MSNMQERNQQDHLAIAGKPYRSRLLVGSGKYRDLEQTREATEARLKPSELTDLAHEI